MVACRAASNKLVSLSTCSVQILPCVILVFRVAAPLPVFLEAVVVWILVCPIGLDFLRRWHKSSRGTLSPSFLTLFARSVEGNSTYLALLESALAVLALSSYFVMLFPVVDRAFYCLVFVLFSVSSVFLLGVILCLLY